jgi:hypothetical protein
MRVAWQGHWLELLVRAERVCRGVHSACGGAVPRKGEDADALSFLCLLSFNSSHLCVRELRDFQIP